MFVTAQKLPKGLGMNSSQSPSLNTHSNRILIISEDIDLGVAMENDLKKLGLQVKVESGSNLDQESPKSLPYDGIILDLDLRETSHLDLFHNLYALNRQIPIVVVGTENMHYDFLFALIGGARDFLVKPVDSVRLKRICLRLFL